MAISFETIEDIVSVISFAIQIYDSLQPAFSASTDYQQARERLKTIHDLVGQCDTFFLENSSEPKKGAIYQNVQTCIEIA